MFFNNPVYQAIANIKADPNYTEDISQVDQCINREEEDKEGTIITPFSAENHVFFKVNKFISIMEGFTENTYFFTKREEHLQVNADGIISILDKDFNPTQEPVTDYLFSQEALSLKDKWLAAGDFKLLEKELGDDCISLCYKEKVKMVEMTIFLKIYRKGNIGVEMHMKSSNSNSSNCSKYEIPKERADSLDFNYEALASYLIEQQVEQYERMSNFWSPA